MGSVTHAQRTAPVPAYAGQTLARTPASACRIAASLSQYLRPQWQGILQQKPWPEVDFRLQILEHVLFFLLLLHVPTPFVLALLRHIIEVDAVHRQQGIKLRTNVYLTRNTMRGVARFESSMQAAVGSG